MNHIRRALTYWYTFGYPEINSPHYIRRLACDNLDMVRRCCMFCQLFLMVMCITRLALVGCEWINLWPFVIASVIVTIILVINNRLDDTKNVLFHSYAQTAVFSVTLVVLAGFYDFIAAPGSIAVMTCMALLCVGSLFDSRPIDNLIAYAIGLAALYAIALAESGPSLVSNLFNMAVSVLLGLCISWYKFRSHFGQLLANDKELKALQHAARVQIMVSQINPHFVCNVLATIQAMCDTDVDKAKEALGLFSAYMRDNTDAVARTEPVPFAMELQHVKRYVSLEQMRFGDKLAVMYDIDTTDFRLPALTVQPIIENAIKHGIGKKENGGFVRLSARERQGVVRIEIADNGVGMDERTLYGLTGSILQTAESVNRPEGDGRSHVGLTNVRERLRLMSHGTLAVSSQPGRGTTVIISIPKGI